METVTVKTTSTYMSPFPPGSLHPSHLVLISSRFLKVVVSAALAVVLSVPLSVSVSVFVSGGFGGGGWDVVPDVIKDTKTQRHAVTWTHWSRLCHVAALG